MAAAGKGSAGVYYGWYVVAVLMLGGIMGAGTAQFFMGVVLKPISDEFGWSRSAISGAITAGNLIAGLLSPIIGRFADRYGARPITTIGALTTGAAMLAIAGIGEIWQFYLAYMVGRGIASSTLGGVVSGTAATNWFRRMRGRAIGLVTLSVPLGGAVLALIAQPIIETAGWRIAFLTFGAFTLLIVAPLAAIIIRRQPEDLGLRPDGADPASAQPAPDDAAQSQPSPAPSSPELSWSFAEAVRTRSLWLIAFGVFASNGATSGVAFHQTAYLIDVGLVPTAAVVALSLTALSGAAASGIWGYLAERWSPRVLSVIALVIAAAGTAYFLVVRDFAAALVAALTFGITGRGWFSLVLVLIARYYGRTSYGAITGFIQPFLSVGLGIGPLIAGLIFDLSGSYTYAFLLFAAAFALSGAALWLAPAPARPTTAGG